MFDFAADGRDEGGEHGVNQKGLVTMDRQLKKDAFYLYKAHWSKQPFVHICGRRYVDRAEAVTEIKVYTNEPVVSLWVDGELFAQQGSKHIATFQLPLSGEHSICAQTPNAEDRIHIRKVATPNPRYRFAKEGDIVNWFDQDQLLGDHFSIMDPLGELMQHPQAGSIVGQLMAKASASRGDVAESVKDNPNLQQMMSRMPLHSILRQAGDAVPAEQIKALNKLLQQIKKPKTSEA